APTETGRPALITAWRAGAWPIAAGNTLPRITRSTSPRLAPARFTASSTATPPRSEAESGESPPWKLPMGVRTALQITTSFWLTGVSFGRAGDRYPYTNAGAHVNQPPGDCRSPIVEQFHALRPLCPPLRPRRCQAARARAPTVSRRPVLDLDAGGTLRVRRALRGRARPRLRPVRPPAWCVPSRAPTPRLRCARRPRSCARRSRPRCPRAAGRAGAALPEP